MGYGNAVIEMPEMPSIEPTMSRAFLAAQLLTGSTGQAEKAVTEAIEAWDPDGEEEDLFLKTMHAALARQPEWLSRCAADSPEVLLPAELRPVLRLPAPLRRCFVLRILVGLSRPVCARLLRFESGQVDDFTCAALRLLAAANPPESIRLRDAAGSRLAVA